MKPSLLAARKRRAEAFVASDSSDDDDGPPQKTASGLAALLARGRAPSRAPRIHTVGGSKDAKDARHLREQMDKLRPYVDNQAEEEQQAYDASALPRWHARALQTHQAMVDGTPLHGDDLISLEGALASAVDFLPYEQLVEISHSESRLATLGGKGACDKTAFVRTSNREKLTFEHVYANLEKLLPHVIHETELFALRPEQRLAIAMEFVRFPEEVRCATKRAGDAKRTEVRQFAIAPGVQPTLSLLTLGTGNGKTIVAILTAATAVCVPALWAEMQAHWRNRVSAGATTESGLSKRPLVVSELARVVIAYVPKQLMEQWKHTLLAVKEELAKRGTPIDTWHGLGVLQRKGHGPNGQASIRRTLSVAHRRSKASGQPLFWIVPADTNSTMLTLRDAPDISFAYRIYDECSTRTEPRETHAKESEPMRNIICQATVGRLQTATQGSRNHPLRRVLEGNQYSETDPDHASIFHLLAVPDWLRLLMGRSLRPVMPSGLRCLHLKIRIQSMAGRLLKSDLTVTCLDDLLKAVLRSTGESAFLTAEETASLIARCKALLASGATPIHTRLVAAAADATAALERLPALAPNPTLEAELAYRPTARKKRVHNAMRRLFEKLAEAVDHDSPPICPISEDPIAPENVGIFTCCTNPYDKRYTEYLNDNCPVCGVNLSGRLLAASDAIDALTFRPPPPPPPRPTFVADEDALIAALEESESATFTSSVKAVISAIQDFLRFRPRGARMLLAFATQDYDERASTARTRRTLLDAVPSLTAVDAVSTKESGAVTRFVAPSDENLLLVINTSSSSISLEGLDLWNADVIILDKCGEGRRLRTETVVQAIGRVLRPQYKDYVPGQPEKEVAYPAKLLVMLEPSETAGEARVPLPEGPEEPDDDVSDEEDDDDGWEHFDPAELVDVVPPH